MGSEAKERSHRCRGQGEGRSLEFPRRPLPEVMIKLNLKDEQVRGGRASGSRNSVCSALSRADSERLVWKWAVGSGQIDRDWKRILRDLGRPEVFKSTKPPHWEF